MRKNTTEKIICIIFIITIIWGLSMWTYTTFFEERNKTITFNVIGVNETQNATTLVQIHFECIKFCVNRLSSGESSQYRCYDECAKLGKCYEEKK